jgi:hypothetical protein
MYFTFYSKAFRYFLIGIILNVETSFVRIDTLTILQFLIQEYGRGFL